MNYKAEILKKDFFYFLTYLANNISFSLIYIWMSVFSPLGLFVFGLLISHILRPLTNRLIIIDANSVLA